MDLDGIKLLDPISQPNKTGERGVAHSIRSSVLDLFRSPGISVSGEILENF